MTPEILEWSHNPWRDRPRHALAGALGAVLLCAVALSLRLPFVMTLALCVVAVAPLLMVFLPMRYRLDEQGISRICGPLAEKRSWERLRRAVRGREGVLLLPFRARSWLDAYLGFFLPIPRGPAGLAAELDRILVRHGL
jgi:hypothetical protein